VAIARQQKDPQAHPRLIPAAAIMRITGADRSRISEWVAEGLVRAVQLPGCPVRYVEADVLELIERCGTVRRPASAKSGATGGDAASDGVGAPTPSEGGFCQTSLFPGGACSS
jgi:hypothetical protein